ncbi:MAG TPA: ATP-binding protein [Thermoanaerobaculia bacterium]|nr:ATP-binding protein [Thermoanaerobaculia bacterium]
MASTDLPTREVELSIDSRLENVALLGAALSGIAAGLGFGESERYHLELCLVEAASNSVRHAYGGEPGHPVRLRIMVDAERIEMRIADRGLPVPPEHRTSPELVEVDPSDLSRLGEGGRGMFLMHTLMDEITFGVEDGWNVLSLTKRRPPA